MAARRPSEESTEKCANGKAQTDGASQAITENSEDDDASDASSENSDDIPECAVSARSTTAEEKAIQDFMSNSRSIYINEKWKKSQVFSKLEDSMSSDTQSDKRKVVFTNRMSVVDFLVYDTPVLYLHSKKFQLNKDGKAARNYRKYIAKFRRVVSEKTSIVLVEKALQEVSDIKKFVMQVCGMTLVVAANLTDVVSFLLQLIYLEHKPPLSTFRKYRKEDAPDRAMLNTIQTLRKLGMPKARELLQSFSCLKEIANASQSELESVIGRPYGEIVYDFFNTKALI